MGDRRRAFGLGNPRFVACRLSDQRFHAGPQHAADAHLAGNGFGGLVRRQSKAKTIQLVDRVERSGGGSQSDTSPSLTSFS